MKHHEELPVATLRPTSARHVTKMLQQPRGLQYNMKWLCVEVAR